MTVELIEVTPAQLQRQRADILSRLPVPLSELRRRAADHVATPDERELLIELEEVDFLLGDDA
jgi:hypothetical protein